MSVILMSLAEGNGIEEMDFPVYEKPIKRPRMQGAAAV